MEAWEQRVGSLANILNIALDYTFIMRLDYGMKGAALASGLSVIIAFALCFLYFAGGRSVFRYCSFSYFPKGLKGVLKEKSTKIVPRNKRIII